MNAVKRMHRYFKEKKRKKTKKGCRTRKTSSVSRADENIG
jgi:hypothetical protein